MATLKSYLERREQLQRAQPVYRIRCHRCVQPVLWCYCKRQIPFDCGITFVILIHPIELRRRIASGRMAHLMLQGSYLIQGQNFSQDEQVNQLLKEPQYFPLILYPGANATNLSLTSGEGKKGIVPKGKRPLVFVVDGTWSTASKTILQSENLRHLPQICFTPKRPSVFLVRKQPDERYLSTIEAVHQLIDLFSDTFGFDVHSRKHDLLMKVFESFVQQQYQLIVDFKLQRRTHRRKLLKRNRN